MIILSLLLNEILPVFMLCFFFFFSFSSIYLRMITLTKLCMAASTIVLKPVSAVFMA